MQNYRWYVESLIQNFTTKILIYNVYALDQNLIVVGSSHPCESCLNDIKVLGTKPSLKRTDVIQIYLNVNQDVADVATVLYIEFTSVRILVCSLQSSMTKRLQMSYDSGRQSS